MKNSDVVKTIDVVKKFFCRNGKETDYDTFCEMLVYQFFMDLTLRSEGDAKVIESVVSSMALTMDRNLKNLKESA